MVTNESVNTSIEEKTILYTYWDDLPSLKIIELDNKLYTKHECRSAVNRILREGVEEPLGRDLKKSRRAMTADESFMVLD